jgi:hypothetical protein
MKFLTKIAIVFTGLFSASTVLCGVSIAQAATIEQSSISFHMGLAILTIFTSFATIALIARSTKPNKA